MANQRFDTDEKWEVFHAPTEWYSVSMCENGSYGGAESCLQFFSHVFGCVGKLNGKSFYEELVISSDQ